MPADREPRRQRLRSLRDRLPKLRPQVGPAGPTVGFDASRRAIEKEAVRRLIVKMSRRRILWTSIDLELPDVSYNSVSELLHDAEIARLELPGGSAVDEVIETLQDACNDLRTYLEHRQDGFPFGVQLYELRAAALSFAIDIEERFGLPEAAALVDKIDMDTALSPTGREERIRYADPPAQMPWLPPTAPPEDAA
jgi:hypothetical protein